MAEQTDIQLKVQSDVIRDETVAGANTKERVASILDNIVDSKINKIALSNVDNTSDAQKVASGPIKSALDEKYDFSNPLGFITSDQSPVQSVAGKVGAISLVKADVGLSNVDNTSDLQKPISVPMSTALSNKVDKVAGKQLSTEDFTLAEKNKLNGIQPLAEPNNITSVAGKTGIVILTKADVSLDNVDNTSDLNKPVSTATATQLGQKESLSNKVTDLSNPSTTTYPSTSAVATAIQDIGAGESYQADWDASTNTPTLTSSVGTEGHYYQVAVAGTTTLNGISSWAVGDQAIFKDGVWKKRESFAITSWAGKTGIVIPEISDIADLSTQLSAKLEAPSIANFETTTQLNARDVDNRNRGLHVGTQLASTISDFQSSVSDNPDVITNLSKRSYPVVDENKLGLIEAEATKNDTNANLRDRSTHTNTQPISSVTNLQTELDSLNATALTDETTYLTTPKPIQEGVDPTSKLITDAEAQTKINTQIPLNNIYQLGLDSEGKAMVRTSNLPASGDILYWNTTGIYGSPNSPLVGDIKINVSDARITDVYLYHKQITEPVWPEYIHKIGVYSTTELNIIRLTRHSNHLFVATITNVPYTTIDVETGLLFDLFHNVNDLTWDEISATGTIRDHAGQGNGILHNPASFGWVDGEVEQAGYWGADIPTSYLTLPTNGVRASLESEFTWASWINRPTIDTAGSDFLNTDAGGGGGIYIQSSNSNQRIECILDRNLVAPSSTTRLRLDGSIAVGVPFHCVFTYDGVRIRGYINGVFSADNGIDYATTGLSDSTDFILNSNTTFTGGSGKFEQERNKLYNRVLSDQEILALYNEKFQYQTV